MTFDIASMLSGNAPELSGRQKAGRALSAISAGLMGQGPQYLGMIQQQDQQAQQQAQQLSAERLKAMAIDAQRVNQLLTSGDIQGALRVVDNRTAAIKQLGGDPSDTLRIRQLITAGAVPEAQAEINGFLTAAQQYGIIEAPKQPEEYTLSPGQQRFKGDQMIAQVAPEAPETFSVLSPEEAAQLGLPTDKQFKRNSVTQEISQIGGSGTTVNVNQGGEMGPGQKKLDELYAQEYYNWRSGGGADQFANIAQIETVLGKLERGDELTGPAIGLAPDWVNALVNPEALNAKQNIEEVVQRNLRVLLGAQFTEREGERLIARAFDARLGSKENAARLRKLLQQMNTAAGQRENMAQFFEKNGTLVGYRGPVPNVQDFFSAIAGVSVGDVIDGYKYTGGDPGSPESWVKQ